MTLLRAIGTGLMAMTMNQDTNRHRCPLIPVVIVDVCTTEHGSRIHAIMPTMFSVGIWVSSYVHYIPIKIPWN